MQTQDPRVKVAIGRMRQMCSSAPPFEQMARSLNLSSSRLCHLIKAETGLPPARYLKQLRIQKAKQLLETTFLSIKEVMAQIGYNDLSHFVRDFKMACGMSPRQYRASYFQTEANLPKAVRNP